jgi:hypothetical protein
MQERCRSTGTSTRSGHDRYGASPTSDVSTDGAIDTEGADVRSVRSPLVLRILGVAGAAFLGIGTFASLGLALAQVLYDRGAIGNAGAEETEALGSLIAGVIVGAAIGLVVSVWVGLRVWQGRWVLLLVLLGVTVVTAATIAISAS